MMSTGYTTLIRGARIVDGSGDPWRYGDVALAGDRIVALAPPGLLAAEAAAEVIDATGMVVAPGIIDIQSHSIVSLMRDGRCLSKITQGVTTEIMGEVWTPAPFGGRITDPFEGAPVSPPPAEWRAQAREWRRFRDWLETMQSAGVSPNIGSFLAGGTLRQYGRGLEMGPATADELATMRRVVAEAMEDGAFGVSYALIYPPEAYVETAEIIAVCAIAARYGGIYITHLRSEGDRFAEAVEEALAIGQGATIPVEIYHLKATGRHNWPKMAGVIARIDAARADGIDVTADMYPYVASGTGLSAVLPAWASADGKLFENLRDPATRARIAAAMVAPAGADNAPGLRRDPAEIMPVGFQLPEHQQYVGQRLARIAATRGQGWHEAAIDLLAAEGQRISTMYFSMSEENLATQLCVDQGGDRCGRRRSGLGRPQRSHSSARLWHLPARPRQVCARGWRAHPRGRRAEDDRCGRGTTRHPRSRRAARGPLRRRDPLRSGDDRRPRDLRRFAPAIGRRA